MSTVKEIRKDVSLNSEEINSLQRERLLATLKFASKESKYYKALCILPDSNPIIWLKKFPILDKPTLNGNIDDILTLPKKGLVKNASSGSSGVQTIGYYTKKEMDVFRAIQTVFWEWGGYRLGDHLFQTGMGLKRGFVKKIKDFLLRTNYLVAFNPQKEMVKNQFSNVPKDKYHFFGYASSLYVYANIARDVGLDGPKFKGSVCWGDKMFEHYREVIKDQFGCKVIETYGTAEGFQMAGQKDLDYMYLMTPEVYVELLDDNGNEVEDGELGNVVVTNLRTKAMPMIRYRIGDLAVKLPREKYPLKRELDLPLLERVVGRDTDIVITPNGSKLIVHTFTGVIEYYTTIQQFRIVQSVKESFEIEYIPTPTFNLETLDKISDHLKEVINDDSITWIFKRVLEIPNSPSGKPQIIKSLLPKPSLTSV